MDRVVDSLLAKARDIRVDLPDAAGRPDGPDRIVPASRTHRPDRSTARGLRALEC